MYRVDETIVQQTLRILNAYPSMPLPDVCIKLNHYFNKEETHKRVRTLCLSMDCPDSILVDYYPLLLFHGNVIGSQEKILKLVLDKDNSELVKLFKRFALDFGLPSHLQRHGTSKNRVFAKMPWPGDQLLSDVWRCRKDPIIGWKPFCDHLLKYCLREGVHTSSIDLPRDKPKRFCIKVAGELERHLPEKYKDLELFKWTLYLS